MGDNQSRVSNETEGPVFIATYNHGDNFYWFPRDVRQVPVGGDPITVYGSAGGCAVKVAVVYNKYFHGKRFVCDLFRVPHLSTLVIEWLSAESGVKSHRGRGVELLTKGKVIRLDNYAADQTPMVVDNQED